MPRNDDDDFDDGSETPTPKPKPAAQQQATTPSKFHPRFVREAEKYGISQEDIDACKDNAELRELVEFERREVETQSRQTGRGGDRPQPTQTATSPPPPPPPEPEWEIEHNEALGDEVKAELKKLGNALLKATRRGDKDRIEALENEIAEHKAELAKERQRNHPLVKRANKVMEKYTHIFATEEERDADPSSVYAANFERLNRYMFGKMKEQGKLTMVPEKDIPFAIAHLFPGAKPVGTDAPPATPGAKGSNGKTRAETWADAGTPPATHRNGAERSGKPGGARAAAQKVREFQRSQGIDAGDDSDDYDDDEI